MWLQPDLVGASNCQDGVCRVIDDLVICCGPIFVPSLSSSIANRVGMRLVWTSMIFCSSFNWDSVGSHSILLRKEESPVMQLSVWNSGARRQLTVLIELATTMQDFWSEDVLQDSRYLIVVTMQRMVQTYDSWFFYYHYTLSVNIPGGQWNSCQTLAASTQRLLITGVFISGVSLQRVSCSDVTQQCMDANTCTCYLLPSVMVIFIPVHHGIEQDCELVYMQ